MNIIPKTAEVILYKSGFSGIDLLNRTEKSKHLSEIVEKIDEPLVIAINGGWGSGKTFFLKCWSGAHHTENFGTAQVVYFDAFKHDFLDDPLIAITAAISERMTEVGTVKDGWSRAKAAAGKLLRPTARVALSIASAGISEVVGGVVDAGVTKTQSILEDGIDSVWKQQESQRAAMESFRTALIDLTKPDESTPAKKLVVIVDELDRCRPDYALSLLETIKHFFDVRNVHFVLGVNLEELANMVALRYGRGANTNMYLQKFINLTMNLPDFDSDTSQHRQYCQKYFRKIADDMDFDPSFINYMQRYFKIPSVSEFLSLRASERILTEMALIPQNKIKFENLYPGYQIVISGLIILKIIFPGIYKKAIAGQLKIDDIYSVFDINREPATRQHFLNQVLSVWKSFLTGESEIDHSESSMFFGGHTVSTDSFNGIIRDFLESVEISSDA